MKAKEYIVGIILVSLLIWGPINRTWPFWLLIRVSYLIIIPLTTWFILKWIWSLWQPTEETEDRFARALAGATSGVLVVFGILELMAKNHIDNTKWIRTRGGMEVVGDDIISQGPDWVTIIVLFLIAVFAFWYSIAKREPR